MAVTYINGATAIIDTDDFVIAGNTGEIVAIIDITPNPVIEFIFWLFGL